MPSPASLTLVGEGLVGSLAAILLARRGLEVEVFERRPDMRLGGAEGGRSINLALSTRGIHALAEAGLAAKVLEEAIAMQGRMVHPLQGEPNLQPYGKDSSECIYSISRAALNALLMDEADGSGRVRIHFRHKAVGMELASRRLTFLDLAAGRTRQVRSEVTIAADGASSAIRAEMMKSPGYACSQESQAHGYKELTIPPGPGDGPGRFRLFANALHIWPRKSFMLIALPNPEGSFTATLFLPCQGPLSFEALKSPADVRSFFAREFPDAAALMPEAPEEFFANPTGALTTVKCFPWHVGGAALLLGDAAHAMVPFYGQGMNCGFEDCTVLGECLLRHPDWSWERVFEEFTRLRKPNTDAISEMALENFVEMRDKVADPRFLLERAVEKALQRAFPQEYVPRYSLVSFTRVPYTLARKAGAAQARILAELASGLKNPERVDLKRAASLIRTELSPIMEEAGMQDMIAEPPRP